MFAFAIAERDSGRLILVPRPARHQAALPRRRSTARLRFASTLPALLAGGGIDTSIDRVALHHYLSWHAVVPPPRTILAGVRKLPPATRAGRRAATARARERRWWGPRLGRAPRARRASTRAQWATLVHDALRRAVRKRMVADVPVGVLLSGGVDSRSSSALLAEEGQKHLQTFSVGFEDVRGQSGRRVRVLRPRRARVRHRPPPAAGAERRAASARWPSAIAAMAEPMTSHDAVAFYLLSREVASTSRSCRAGRAPTRSSAATTGTRRCSSVEGLGDEEYAAAFFDRSPRRAARAAQRRTSASTRTRSRAFVTSHFKRDGRRPRARRGRCASTARSCSSTTRSSASTT